MSQNEVDVNSQFSLEGQDELLKQNAQLKEVISNLREQFKTIKFAKADSRSLDSLQPYEENPYSYNMPCVI
ncbi:MAG: hypothetical protein ACOX81_05310 [Candidatus Heteroscillospira sp.]|jgi:hypothetical protein